MANKNSIFVDNSAPAVNAQWLNINQTEMNNLITSSGQTVDNTGTVNNQEAIGVASIAAQGSIFCTDSGIANAYIATQVSPFPAPFALTNGLTIKFRPGNSNTGASTINAFGFGVKNIKLADGATNPPSGIISSNSDVTLRYNGTNFLLNNSYIGTASTSLAGTSLLPQQIIPSNNATNPTYAIDFAAGNFQFLDGSGRVPILAITKNVNATWAAGTNQGSLDTGSIAANTWYYIYGIYNPTTQVSDIITSTSNSAPSLPSGFTKYGLIHTFLTDSSSHIITGTWNANKTFIFNAPIVIIASTAGNGTVTGLLPSLNCHANVLMQLNTVSAGVSNFGVYGNLQPNQTDPTYISTIETNNGYSTSGTGIVYASNGSISYKNFSTAGGISLQGARLMSYTLINN